jgi:hypothetical protein
VDAISATFRSIEANLGRPLASMEEAATFVRGSWIQNALVRNNIFHPAHGQSVPPCSHDPQATSCQGLLQFLGIRFVP